MIWSCCASGYPLKRKGSKDGPSGSLCKSTPVLFDVEEHPLDVFLHTAQSAEVFFVCVELMGTSQRILLHVLMLLASFFIK